MTDGTQAIDLVNQDQAVSQSAPMQQSMHQEKVLTQSEVNDLIGRKKAEAYEQGKREALAQFQPAPQAQQQQVSQMGGMQQFNPDQLRNMVAEEAQRQLQYHAQMAQGERIANEFTQKMMSAKDKYPDFEQVVSGLDFSKIPQIVQLANGSENTADIMYDLAQNPHKIANLLTLANTDPRLAHQGMQKLSASIKQNQSVENQKNAREPLSQVTPSITGTDNGSQTISDLRKQPWLRG